MKITKQRLRRQHEFGVGFPRAQGLVLRGSGLSIHIRISTKSGVRMVIKDPDPRDLLIQPLIDYLDVS
jgi:hypothetical protein